MITRISFVLKLLEPRTIRSLVTLRDQVAAFFIAARASSCFSAWVRQIRMGRSQVLAHTPGSPAAATQVAVPVKTPVLTKHTASRHHHRHHQMVTAPAPPPMNPIPQGNSGDHDADNNGGPIDGDGNV
jgi:hypothetical protein